MGEFRSKDGLHITSNRTCTFSSVCPNFNIGILTQSFVLKVIPKQVGNWRRAKIVAALPNVFTFFLHKHAQEDIDEEYQQSKLAV